MVNNSIYNRFNNIQYNMTAKEKQKQSDLQRIKRVMNFYYNRGCNKESVNDLYRKILASKFNNK